MRLPISRSVLFTFGVCGILGAPVCGSAAEHTINQKNKKFSVESIDAKIGDTLIFTNDETDITHNVYSLSPGNSFELKTQKPGERSNVELTAGQHSAGQMEVECAIHPRMKLVVNITE